MASTIDKEYQRSDTGKRIAQARQNITAALAQMGSARSTILSARTQIIANSPAHFTNPDDTDWINQHLLDAKAEINAWVTANL